jgi:hypothetical protein
MTECRENCWCKKFAEIPEFTPNISMAKEYASHLEKRISRLEQIGIAERLLKLEECHGMRTL